MSGFHICLAMAAVYHSLMEKVCFLDTNDLTVFGCKETRCVEVFGYIKTAGKSDLFLKSDL